MLNRLPFPIQGAADFFFIWRGLGAAALHDRPLRHEINSCAPFQPAKIHV